MSDETDPKAGEIESWEKWGQEGQDQVWGRIADMDGWPRGGYVLMQLQVKYFEAHELGQSGTIVPGYYGGSVSLSMPENGGFDTLAEAQEECDNLAALITVALKQAWRNDNNRDD